MVYKYHFEPIPSEWLSDPVLSRTEPLVLQILANRGFKTAAEVSVFLFPDFSAVIKAVGLKDMDKLVERLSRALNGHEKIVVYHDYAVAVPSWLKIFGAWAAMLNSTQTTGSWTGLACAPTAWNKL